MANVTVAWAAEVGVISWRDWRNAKRLPFPSEVLATFLIFGLLSVLPDSTGNLAPLLGWGLVLATVVHAFDPSKLGASPAMSGINVSPNTTGPSVTSATPVTLTPLQGGQQ